MSSSVLKFLLLVVCLFSLVIGDCRNGWLHHGTSCYYFSSDSRDWVSAAGTCKAHGAELVIIDSQGENDFITAEIMKLRGEFWLDGTDEFSEGTWEWASTGSLMDYTNWYPGEPNNGGDEDCLMTSDVYKGTWNDSQCSAHKKFICEMDFPPSVVG